MNPPTLHPRHITRLTQDRLRVLAAREPESSRRRPSLAFLKWVRKHILVRGVAWSLKRHEYLLEPYQALESHPYIVFEKAAQVGCSTAVLLSAFHECDQRRAKVLYYLSTDQDAFDFSNDRINLTIDDSPYLKELVDERERGRDNVGLRHIGKGSLFCRGMFTRRKVKAVDGDVLVLDELDEADQDNKQFAFDRILHSDIQFVRELSQPSIPDYGIDETFCRSDQRFWHLKCPACGKWTCLELALEERDKRPVPMAFLQVPRNATWAKPGQRYYRACLHCEAPLDMSCGRWVARYPSRKDVRGYHLSQLYTQVQAAGYADPADRMMSEILGARRTRERMRVTISVIGFPYAGDNQPVTDEVLDAAEGDQGLSLTADASFLGIDQGDLLHIVVAEPAGSRLRVIHLEVTDDFARARALMTQYKGKVLVTDALPNKHDAKRLVRAIGAMPGRKGYIQYFAGDTLKQDEEGEGKQVVPKVSVDRDESLDETTRELQERQIILPAMSMLGPDDLRTYEMFRAQCKMLVKDLEESAKGVLRWSYKKRVPNHFGMALNSCRIARELAEFATGGEVAERKLLGV